MPAKSQAQRAFLAATKGIKWMRTHHFANKGKLLARVKKSTKKRGKR